MTMALRSKNKRHFISGSLSRPLDEDHNSVAWDQCNTMIMSWIHNSAKSDIAQSVLWMDTAAEIWNEQRDHFYQGDIFKISELQEEICHLKQGDSSISSYYSKLKKLWQESDNFCLIPECSCDITCQAVIKIRAYKDGDQVIRFLKSLNDQYSAMRSQNRCISK